MTTPADLIGSLLDGRYRLIALLGDGPTATTYLGEDVSLQRQVAVRVAHAAKALDPEFRQRFAAEAKAIAGLNHPSILRVYDWSDDAASAFMVLEYLPGGSLRQVLDQHGTLTLPQVVSVGSQAAHALASAHASGIVHGAVTPANLLFDEDDRIRLTDFHAVPAGRDPFASGEHRFDLEHAKYASPEEALGMAIDGRSDVYALAVVLYEAATGSVPFDATSAISTLMARVGVALPHHPSLGQLDALLARAAAPEPDARLDAAGFAERLDALAATLPGPGPISAAATRRSTATAVVQGTQTTGIMPQPDATAMIQESVATSGTTAAAVPMQSSIGFRPPSATELTGSVPTVTNASQGIAGAGRDPMTMATAAVAAGGLGAEQLTDVDDAPDWDGPRRRRWPWVVAVLLLLGLLGGGYLAYRSVNSANVPVPNVVGATKDQATTILADARLVAAFGPGAISPTIPVGQVISQSVAPGTKVKSGRVVTLELSIGAASVTVPSLAGLSCTQAEAQLATAQLHGTCPTAATSYSSTVPAGQVVSYTVAGSTDLNPPAVPSGSTIVLSISGGDAPTAVPDVRGLSYTDAATKLTAAGFVVTQGSEFSSTIPLQQVVRTVPAAGSQLAKGGSVTVYVSTGPAPVVVPSVQGLTASQATAAISGAGLNPQILGTAGTCGATVPPAGTSVQPGSTVTCTLSG